MKTDDLEDMMHEMFWKDILYEIVRNMNPWDIDISQLATRYAEKVENMKKMNFKIPANVVIVSSVLLRMKADMINSMSFNPDDYYNDYKDMNNKDENEFEFILQNFDPTLFAETNMQSEMSDWASVAIAIKPKRVPKRRVTVFELISAIQEVLEDKKIKSYRMNSKSKSGGKSLEININRDMEKLIEETYLKVIEILSNKKIVLFSEIAHDRDEIISTLISLLHLSYNQRLKLKQERLFDEIFIKAA